MGGLGREFFERDEGRWRGEERVLDSNFDSPGRNYLGKNSFLELRGKYVTRSESCLLGESRNSFRACECVLSRFIARGNRR